MPAPSTPPTMECVVETGAPNKVARFNQTAPASKADNINQTNVLVSAIFDGFIIPFFMVETTSPPANKAPAASNIAAITIAQNKVIAFDPTAGPTLLATSLAPIFIAI